MGLMDIELTSDGHGYNVPGVGVVPRVSRLLDLLDHPRKRDALRGWEHRCLVKGAMVAGPEFWTEDTGRLLYLGGGTEASDRGVQAHETIGMALATGSTGAPGTWTAEAIDHLVEIGLAGSQEEWIEEAVYVPDLGVAGTADLVFHDGKVTTVVDWKTGKMDRRRWTRQALIYASGFMRTRGAPTATRLYAGRIDLERDRVTLVELTPEPSDYDAVAAAAAVLKYSDGRN